MASRIGGELDVVERCVVTVLVMVAAVIGSGTGALPARTVAAAALADVGGHPSELDRRDLASMLASVGDTELCGLTRVEVSISRAR